MKMDSFDSMSQINQAPSFLSMIRDGVAVAGPVSAFGGSSLALQDDGKLLTAGEKIGLGWVLMRLTADGTLDKDFGNDGTLIAKSYSYDQDVHVTVQPDKKIVLSASKFVSYLQQNILLYRFNQDGSLDTSFDRDGSVNTSLGNGIASSARVATIQNDGKILVAGDSHDDSFSSKITLLRYHKDGSLDSSFGTGGKLTTEIGSGSEQGESVVVQKDNKIILAGYYSTDNNTDYALIRYLDNGSLDQSFSGDGKVTLDFGGTDYGVDVIEQSDGKILVSGFSYINGSYQHNIARLNADGTLDKTFSGDGKLSTDRLTSGTGDHLALQDDGKILVAGNHHNGFNNEFAVVRFNPDGSIDPSFGTNGRVTTPFSGGSLSYDMSIAVQSDGKFVISGLAPSGGNANFVVARYERNGELDYSFGLDNLNGFNGMLNYTENGSAITLEKNIEIFDPNLSLIDNFSGSSLTLGRKAGPNAEDIYSGAGIVPGLTAGDIAVSNTNIGNYTYSNGLLKLDFNSNATREKINQALRSLSYQNGSDAPPEQVELEWTFDDGNSGGQGTGGSLSTKANTFVRVFPINDLPGGALSILGSAVAGQTLSINNTLSDADGLGVPNYQWYANHVPIAGATQSTYILTQSDIGKTITITISYVDGYGRLEFVTSQPTDAVNEVVDTSSPVDDQTNAQPPSSSDSEDNKTEESPGQISEPVEKTNDAPFQPLTFFVPIQNIDAIGLSPDGQYLIIKTNGLTQTVPTDALLTFLDTTTSASELTGLIDPTPVFASVVNGATQYVLPEQFTGPASLNLKYQLIDSTRNAVLKGSYENDFIKVAHETSDGKAIDAGEGDDVVDGGVGSTFITGGGGSNTFFLDGRAPGVSWSTITDFKLGTDKATIWGWKQGLSHVAAIEINGGAEGYQGLTLHFENLLPDDAAPGQTNLTLNSITLTRLGLSDLGVNSLSELNAQIDSGDGGYFQVDSVSDQYGDHGYLYIS